VRSGDFSRFRAREREDKNRESAKKKRTRKKRKRERERNKCEFALFPPSHTGSPVLEPKAAQQEEKQGS
jgi:hypothetical protein